MSEDCTLGCEGATLAYQDAGRTNYALRDISLVLPSGRFHGIMGPSGSGKSSLLYVLSGLKPATQGSARFGNFIYSRNSDTAITDLRRRRFGFVFQQPFLLPYLTAVENIVIAGRQQDKATRDRSMHLIETLGMSGLENKLPSQLSGGEKQRVSVIRAMINEPDVIFADEPTAALDRTNGHLVVDTLASWRDRGGTVVVVTHDPEMLLGADTVLLLRDGRIDTDQQRIGATRGLER